MSTHLSDTVAAGEARLDDAGVPTPRVDALLLIAHVLGLSRGEVEAQVLLGRSLTPDERARCDALITRRAAREPLQHIVGVAPFRHLELEVGPGVFVPRPETEFVTQVALEALEEHARGRQPTDQRRRVVDLCTGSGAIALAIASEQPDVDVWGIELSEDALHWALRNLNRLGTPNAIIEHGDAATALPELDGTVALVVSNPPYIPSDAIPRDPEVQLFDPELALYGGSDGLEVVRAVSVSARRLLEPGGSVVIEHGEFQGQEVANILESDGFTQVHTLQDLTERDRVTLGRR